MEFAKKYALIPEDQWTKHTPTKVQLSELDREMSKILNNASLDEYTKLQKYYEILQRKMKMQTFNTPWKPAVEELPTMKMENNYDTTILNSVPKSTKKQAETLLQLLKQHPQVVGWNEKGELMLNGELRPNTNLADLFHLIFSNTKKVNIPGKIEFLSSLQDLNIPKYYVKNTYLVTPKEEISYDKNIVKWDTYK